VTEVIRAQRMVSLLMCNIFAGFCLRGAYINPLVRVRWVGLDQS